MQRVQNILLVIGASALGIVSCVVLALVAAAIVSAPRAGEQPSLNWGGAILFTILAVGGGIIGGIGGCVGSIRWIAQRPREPWTLTTWIGVMLGVATAVAIRGSGALDTNVLGDLLQWWPGLILFVAATACLGGILGAIAGARGKRLTERERNRFPKSK